MAQMNNAVHLVVTDNRALCIIQRYDTNGATATKVSLKNVICAMSFLETKICGENEGPVPRRRVVHHRAVPRELDPAVVPGGPQ